MFSASVLALKTGHLTYHKLLVETPHLSSTLSFGQYFRSVFTEEQFSYATILFYPAGELKGGNVSA